MMGRKKEFFGRGDLIRNSQGLWTLFINGHLKAANISASQNQKNPTSVENLVSTEN